MVLILRKVVIGCVTYFNLPELIPTVLNHPGCRFLRLHNWTYFIQQRLRGLSFIYSQDRLTIILGDLYQGHVFSLSYKRRAHSHMCAAPHIRVAAHVRRCTPRRAPPHSNLATQSGRRINHHAHLRATCSCSPVA